MKRFLFFIAALFLTIGVEAKSVDKKEAYALAVAFLKQPEVVNVPSAFDCLHIFNSEKGFVIISGDDRTLPVIGYSFNGPFTNDMAESTCQWLQDCNFGIRAAVELDIEASEEVRTAWESLRKEGRLPSACRFSVSPLIFTQWTQYPPYNQYCPEGSMTGCVALTMAQLMRYWEYPTKGVGSHSYIHSTYGQLSANFGSTTYDWNNMPVRLYESSSDAAKRAVATLVYHCGVAVETNYGQESSSAPSNNVLDAMPQYFGYSTDISKEYKRDYTDNQWKRLLMDELDALRPFFYTGQNRYAHAFICDGYDEQGYFHFNWGWGGNNDGYYAIGSLTPGQYTFDVNNYVIIGIKPSNGAMPPIPAPVEMDAYPSGYNLVLEWWMSFNSSNYTYKVSRNGILIASGLTNPAYVDQSASSGTYIYEVWAVLNGVDSDHKISYEVELARVDAVPDDPSKGTVKGCGIEEIGIYHTLKAIPNPGYTFLCWMEDGQVVSTQAEYHTVISGDRQLIACFSGLGVEEDDETARVLRTEIFTLNGVKLMTLSGDALNWERQFSGFARGAYLVKLTTDKGIVVKKIVR